MKVAVVSPYALDRPGGVQSHARQLTDEVVARGVNAWLVGPGRGASTPTEIRVGGGFQFRANGSLAPVAISPLVGRRLLRAVAGADVIHIHEPWIPLLGWVAQLTSTPTVLTFHADPTALVRRSYRGFARVLGRLADRAVAVTVVSQTAASAVEPFAPAVVTIPNAVNANPRADRPDRGPSVVFVGRDEERKGLRVLLNAWPAVRGRVPEARLTVITSRRQQPREGVEVLVGADDAVKLDVLARSAVFVAPNLGGESFGITLAEGMAAGCAVVATDLPAFVDLLDGAGMHTPVGDSEALGLAIGDLLDDDGRRAGLAAASLDRVQNFTWEQVAPRYLDLYESAVKAPPRKGTKEGGGK